MCALVWFSYALIWWVCILIRWNIWSNIWPSMWALCLWACVCELCFECVATTLLMCYFCCRYLLCFFLFVVCLWCSVCVIFEDLQKLFLQHKFKEGDCCSFWFVALCKTTWSVHDILMKKWHMWDTIFYHVANIWPLSADHGCCYSEWIFW